MASLKNNYKFMGKSTIASTKNMSCIEDASNLPISNNSFYSLPFYLPTHDTLFLSDYKKIFFGRKLLKKPYLWVILIIDTI